MKTELKLKVNFEVELKLNETEVRALDALVGYGFRPFIDAFYEKLGKAYMEDHEAGLKSLFESIENIRPALGRINEIKKASMEALKKYNP